MKFSIFSLTNSISVRGKNFISNSEKKNNLIIQIMSENKHKHLYLNFLVYLVFFPLTLVFLFLKFISSKQKTLIVLFPGVLELLFLKVLNYRKSKTIGFDFFTSFYLTLIEDRKQFSNKSIISKFLIFIDRLVFKISDFQFVESNEMKDYLNEKLNINTGNTYVLPTPRRSDYTKQPPSSNKKNYCQIVFWGNFASMHGLDHILDSAKELNSKKYSFKLIGDGKLLKDIKKRIKMEKIENIELTGNLPFYDSESIDDIVSNILSADICLGTFSNTTKNNLIIPHKIIEAMSFSKPVITADSLFVRNNLKGVVKAIKPENGKDLALNIEELYNNKDLMDKFSKAGHEFFKKNFSERTFKESLETIVT